MEWRFLALLAAVLILVGATGCLSSPEPPISRIPKVLTDYIHDEGVFSVYVHGTSECKYRNVRITVDNVTVFDENYTYYGAYRTNKTYFNLSIEVLYQKDANSEPDHYFYNATVQYVSYESSFVVTDYNGENMVSADKGPYIALMECAK